MKPIDALSTHYSDLLDGTYDCIDRIVLNAYCPMLLTPGGVRNWYRQMEGSDQGLSDARLIRYAVRFSRKVQAFCKKKAIPFVYFQAGERKHEEAEKLLPQDNSFTGIFAIFCSRDPSLLWEVKQFPSGSIDIRRKEKTSLLNHYYFHIMDKRWGHLCIRMCAHPPFSCNVILNGHEWVERHPDFKHTQATKEGNCFTSYHQGEKLTRIADTLKHKGQFGQVCQKWIYRCLWFAIDKDEQRRSGFEYKYSIYQIEYSRNLLFKRGRQMDVVYQNIIDLTRSPLDIKRVKTIFRKSRRGFKHKYTSSAPEVCIETPQYNLTIFKIHFGRLTVKLYDKGERTLRAEVVVHNTKDLKCHRSLESFAEVTNRLEEIMGNFLNNLNYAHVAMIDDATFVNLSKPTQTGKNRLAGVNFNQQRTIRIAESLLSLAMIPGGFTSRDLSISLQSSGYPHLYSCRNASYDLKKFRGKQIVSRINGSIRYQVTSRGIKLLCAILCILQREAPALITLLNSEIVRDKELFEMEKLLFAARENIEKVSELFGVKLAA